MRFLEFTTLHILTCLLIPSLTIMAAQTIAGVLTRNPGRCVHIIRFPGGEIWCILWSIGAAIYWFHVPNLGNAAMASAFIGYFSWRVWVWWRDRPRRRGRRARAAALVRVIRGRLRVVPATAGTR